MSILRTITVSLSPLCYLQMGYYHPTEALKVRPVSGQGLSAGRDITPEGGGQAAKPVHEDNVTGVSLRSLLSSLVSRMLVCRRRNSRQKLGRRELGEDGPTIIDLLGGDSGHRIRSFVGGQSSHFSLLTLAQCNRSTLTSLEDDVVDFQKNALPWFKFVWLCKRLHKQVQWDKFLASRPDFVWPEYILFGLDEDCSRFKGLMDHHTQQWEKINKTLSLVRTLKNSTAEELKEYLDAFNTSDKYGAGILQFLRLENTVTTDANEPEAIYVDDLDKSDPDWIKKAWRKLNDAKKCGKDAKFRIEIKLYKQGPRDRSRSPDSFINFNLTDILELRCAPSHELRFNLGEQIECSLWQPQKTPGRFTTFRIFLDVYTNYALYNAV